MIEFMDFIWLNRVLIYNNNNNCNNNNNNNSLEVIQYLLAYFNVVSRCIVSQNYGLYYKRVHTHYSILVSILYFRLTILNPLRVDDNKSKSNATLHQCITYIIRSPIFIKKEWTKMPSLPFYKEFNEILVLGYLCLIWMRKMFGSIPENYDYFNIFIDIMHWLWAL
jgi:hypothetical protein